MAPAALLLAQDSTALYKKAAHLFLESVVAAIKAQGRATVAVSGGSTPKKLFELLAEPFYAERINWPKVHFFWVDERCVPPHHPDSNYGMTQAALLTKIALPVANVHRVAGEMSSPLEAARAYENELRAFFKLTQSPPHFDFILLGIGEDGHTASLFPKSEALHETEHWTAAAYVEKFSSHRVTLTLPVLNNAARALFLVAGASKAEILRQVFTPEANHSKYPAQMISPTSGELIWLFDKDAASKIPATIRYQAAHI